MGRADAEAGVNITYSIPGLKVHAKVALVKMMKGNNRRCYGFFGTGNLNESTAKIYCDYGLFTCSESLTKELSQVFRHLISGQTPNPFEHLIVSQFGALEHFTELIDREIELSKESKDAHIILKLNNLEEHNLIQKLYEAAEAGVKVEIIARSICCLVPGVNGIEVSRIVDRYLEHARLFYFKNDGKPKLFAGSSDWMSRNLHRRIEVSFPIYNYEIKQQLIKILNIQLADNSKRVLLNADLANVPIERESHERVRNAQSTIRAYIEKSSLT